jgi:hypothetical protein
MNYGKMMPLLLLALHGVGAASPAQASDAVTSQELAASSVIQNQLSPEPVTQNKSSTTQIRDAISGGDLRKSTNVACALEEYKSFFWHFVRGRDYQNNEMRHTYTWSDVQIRDYQDPSKLLGVISKKNYDAFKIGLIDYALVYVDPSTKNLSVSEQLKNRLKIDIKRLDQKTFRVDYIQAEFAVDPEAEDNNGALIRTYGQPGAYIFEHRQGCWNLTQDLRTKDSTTRSPVQSETARLLSTDPQVALEKVLKVDMPYVTLRQAALKSGWQPIINPQCQANVGNSELCNRLPELDSCGKQTACRMYFEHKSSGKKLQVITRGSYNYVLSRQSKLHVFSWQFIQP